MLAVLCLRLNRAGQVATRAQVRPSPRPSKRRRKWLALWYVLYILYTLLHIYERVALRWVTTAAASSSGLHVPVAFVRRVCLRRVRAHRVSYVGACVRGGCCSFKKPQGVSTGGPVDTETAAKRQEFAENMGQKTDFGQAPKGYVAGMGAWRSIRSSACF